MIQSYLKDELALAIPELEWTIDYYAAKDNTATVYSEGGPGPDPYDTRFRYPQYQVLIRSSDWGFAGQAAQKVFGFFYKKSNLSVSNSFNTYRIYLIEPMGEPLRLGVRNDVMEWTVNLQVTLREER